MGSESEASGPVDVVQAQWEAFSDLVKRQQGSDTRGDGPIDAHTDAVDAHVAEAGAALDRIMKHDGRCVSLAAPGASPDDEILLLLLGQQMLRANHLVMGGELLQGLV